MYKKNVAILVGRISGSGPARVASNLSLYLPDEHYNKTVIIYYEEDLAYEISGKLINLNTPSSKNPIKKIRNTIKRIRTLKKIKKEYNIDTTISLLPNPNLVNILSRYKDKVIISERSFMSKEHKGINGILYKLIYQFLYKKADVITAVSEVVKLDLIQSFGVVNDKIKVMYNFYDIEKISFLSKEMISEQNNEIFNYPTIITAGRLSYQKGQWHLIRAFKEVKKKIPNAKLLILGEGDLSGYLKKLTKELGLEQDIQFLGFQVNPFKYIARADVYAFPSLYEGFPNALAEAMACDLPVISSDCQSGPREILSPSLDIESSSVTNITYAEFGILIPTCDGEMYDANVKLTKEEVMIADAIVELLNDEEMFNKYRRKAKERMEAFRKDKIISDWENLLDG